MCTHTVQTIRDRINSGGGVHTVQDGDEVCTFKLADIETVVCSDWCM